MDALCFVNHRPLFMSQGESPSSIDADSVSTFMVLQWNGFWIMGPHGLQKMGLSCALGWIGKEIAFPLGPQKLYVQKARNCRPCGYWCLLRYMMIQYDTCIFILNPKLGVDSFFIWVAVQLIGLPFHSWGMLGYCMATHFSQKPFA